MGIRYNHLQVIKTASMALGSVLYDANVVPAATHTAKELFRAYIDPGFNGTLEWLDIDSYLSIGNFTTLKNEVPVISTEWQIRCRGEATFTKICDGFVSKKVIGYTGTATAGSTTTLTDTTANWGINALAGFWLYNNGRIDALILSNTATVITVASGATFAASAYSILGELQSGNNTAGIRAQAVYDAVAGTTDAVPYELRHVLTSDKSVGFTATLPIEANADPGLLAIRTVGVSV